MPVVYEISALYRRMVRPAEFENATAEIGLKAQLEEDDDLDAVSAQLLDTCRKLALKAVTGKVLGKTEAEVTVEKKTGRKISETPEDRGEQEEEKPKKKRETAAAKKKRLEAEAAAEEASEFPEEEDGPPAEAPDDDYDAGAFEDDDGDDIISANDLQNFITGSVADKLITVTAAKEVMLEHGDGAGRTKDVPDASRNAVHEQLQKVIAANKAKKAKK